MHRSIPACTLLFALAAATPADAGFRDVDGDLVLPDCATASAWLPVAGDVTADDQSAVLDGALDCVKQGEVQTARALQSLADAAPNPAWPEEVGAEVERVRLLLALGDIDPASERLPGALVACGQSVFPGSPCTASSSRSMWRQHRRMKPCCGR